ncbi:MAG: hypothetical protein IPL41_09350 [Micropruina sp.]|nr:hypothetical protein [Micropruina sp.]
MSVARQAKLWQWGALVYTLIASVFFAFMPLVAVPGGDRPRFVSAFAMLGWGVFGPLLLPIVLTLIPIVVRRSRVRVAWICTAVLGLICVLLALSWGLIFVPAPLIGAMGAYLTGRAPIEDVEIVDAPWKVPGD